MIYGTIKAGYQPYTGNIRLVYGTTTLSMKTLRITTLRITTLSIMTLSIMTLSIAIKLRHSASRHSS